MTVPSKPLKYMIQPLMTPRTSQRFCQVGYGANKVGTVSQQTHAKMMVIIGLTIVPPRHGGNGWIGYQGNDGSIT